MKIRHAVWVCLAGAFLLFAGTAMSQSIFADKDLSVSPAMTLAQASTAKAAPEAPCANCSHRHHHEWAEKELTAEEKADRDKKKAEREKEASYWGGFGGAGANYLMLDMSPFDPMTDDRDIDNFDPLVTVGGLGGLIYKGFRFGGFGFGASQRTEDEVSGDHRKAVIDIGGGGLFFELDTTFSRKFGLFIGSNVAAGSIGLHAKGDDLSTVLGEEGKFDANRAVFFANPYVGFWLAPTDWAWVRVDGGWNYFHVNTSSNQFENDFGVDMVDGPIKGNFQVGLNLCFGYIPKGK